jgi:hypothetical protein
VPGKPRPVTPIAIRFGRKFLTASLCPFRESVATWFSFPGERTNSQLTERTKKMNSENIKNITNQAIEQLIEALKAGNSEAFTNYLAAVAKFHRYSFQNILLIARQCPQAIPNVKVHRRVDGRRA